MPRGIVRSYLVNYTSDESNTVMVTQGLTSVEIMNLKPSTIYSVTVAGFTVALGDLSSVVMVITPQDSK